MYEKKANQVGLCQKRDSREIHDDSRVTTQESVSQCRVESSFNVERSMQSHTAVRITVHMHGPNAVGPRCYNCDGQTGSPRYGGRCLR